MHKDQDKAVHKLNDLIQICNDGKKGFADAAENIKDGNIQTVFHSASQQRADFAAQLKNEVSKMGGEATAGGDAKGALHRIWMDVRSAFAGNDHNAVLNEVERGEEAAVKEYNKAIDTAEMPEYLKETLRQQQSRIQETLNEVKRIKTAAA